MRKVICVFLISIFLTSCSANIINNKTPKLESVFEKEANVSFGDFSYLCKICRMDDKSVIVKILNTSAKGLTMKFDGENLDFEYFGKNYSVTTQNVDRTNIAIAVFDVYSVLESDENVEILRQKKDVKYLGKTFLGSFKVNQNEDFGIYEIVFQGANIQIKFR